MSRPRFSTVIHDKLMAAIDQLAVDGRDVSFAAVAKTAGHARGLISKGDCPYAAVRERILDIKSADRSTQSKVGLKAKRRSVEALEGETLRAELRMLHVVVNDLSSALAASIVAAKAASSLSASSGQQEDLEKRLAARRERAAAESLT